MVFFLYEKCIFKHTFKFIPSNFVSYIETHLLSKSAFKVMVYIFFLAETQIIKPSLQNFIYAPRSNKNLDFASN